MKTTLNTILHKCNIKIFFYGKSTCYNMFCCCAARLLCWIHRNTVLQFRIGQACRLQQYLSLTIINKSNIPVWSTINEWISFFKGTHNYNTYIYNTTIPFMILRLKKDENIHFAVYRNCLCTYVYHISSHRNI